MADKFRAIVFPIVLVMGAFIFLATGVYAGYEFASMRGETSAWSCLTYSADNYVRALSRLKGGRFEDATAGLESALDVNVVLIGGSDRKDVRDTLSRVKNYRAQHPWSGSGPEVSSRVTRALADVK
jgi:hypothetical protein